MLGWSAAVETTTAKATALAKEPSRSALDLHDNTSDAPRPAKSSLLVTTHYITTIERGARDEKRKAKKVGSKLDSILYVVLR